MGGKKLAGGQQVSQGDRPSRIEPLNAERPFVLKNALRVG